MRNLYDIQEVSMGSTGVVQVMVDGESYVYAGKPVQIGHMSFRLPCKLTEVQTKWLVAAVKRAGKVDLQYWIDSTDVLLNTACAEAVKMHLHDTKETQLKAVEQMRFELTNEHSWM